MAIQFGTVDGLVNITEDSILCFAKGINEFVSQGGPSYASENRVSYGTAFQRFVDPVYNNKKETYDLESINQPVRTKSGAEQSPARVTFCKKMGLLNIDETIGLFEITPIGKAIIDNDITIKEYAFILLSKMGVFKDGVYVDNLLSSVSRYFQSHAIISQNRLEEYIKHTYNDNDTDIVKTRLDIILNSLVVTGLLTKVGNDVFVLSGTGEAGLFIDYYKHFNLINVARIDTSNEYGDYIGNLEYGGVFDILNSDNIEIYTKFYPNLSKYMKKNIDVLTLQQIFYGAPGTGKSHEVKKQTGELLENGEERDLPNVFRTTFHPDTDYASFVGCYKPTMRKTGKKHQVDGKDVDDEEIIYEFVPQTFTDAYVYAYNNPTEQTYLVIEEINRGNCAQIFGDLFQLLDRKGGVSEYKIKADKDLAKYLSDAKDKTGSDILGNKEGIKDGKLCLPANLNILATMNTSDQSLFPMDSAFKRRWEWEYVRISEGRHEDGSSLNYRIQFTVPKDSAEEPELVDKSWWNFVKAINKQIEDATKSEDKKLGYFFCKPDKKADESDKYNTIISAETFVGKVVFYLWQDVFKDYGFKSDIFKRANGKKISFHDFYPDNITPDEATNPEAIDLPLVKEFIEKVIEKYKEQASEA